MRLDNRGVFKIRFAKEPCLSSSECSIKKEDKAFFYSLSSLHFLQTRGTPQRRASAVLVLQITRNNIASGPLSLKAVLRNDHQHSIGN